MRLQRFLDALSRLQQRHALLLFLALGAALFTIETLRQQPAPLIAPEQSASDARAAERWLEEEVLYREALARGLDEGDLIVRRRLVQKMRLLLETGVEVAEPDELQLRVWIDTHAGRYGGVAQISLEHVFLSRGRHDARLAAAAQTMKQQLESGSISELAALSDPHPAGTMLMNADLGRLDRLLGTALTAQLAELPAGSWQGPLPSALGMHFVRISERQLRAPDYAQVRERAQRDYLLEHRREQTRLALDQLKAQYGLSAPTGLP